MESPNALRPSNQTIIPITVSATDCQSERQTVCDHVADAKELHCRTERDTNDTRRAQFQNNELR